MNQAFKRTIYAKVGRLLLEERLCRHLILEKVSAESGLSMEDIDRIESGKTPTWKKAVKLVDYYGKVIKFTLTDGGPPEYLKKLEEEKADNS